MEGRGADSVAGLRLRYRSSPASLAPKSEMHSLGERGLPAKRPSMPSHPLNPAHRNGATPIPSCPTIVTSRSRFDPPKKTNLPFVGAFPHKPRVFCTFLQPIVEQFVRLTTPLQVLA